MRLLLKNPVVVSGGSSYAADFRRMVNEYAGQWVEVETEHLFGDQFNVAVPNARITLGMVAAIEDDVRLMAAKCCYCGYGVLDLPDDDLLMPCPRCESKTADGFVAYTLEHMAVMDRIRPCVGLDENGRVYTMHANRQIVKFNPNGEGEVWKYGPVKTIRKRASR